MILDKKCNKCLVFKAITEFNKDKTRKDGLAIWCRVCSNQYNSNWRQDAPLEKREKAKQDTKQWVVDNYDRHIQTTVNWRNNNKEFKKQINKKWWDNNKQHHITYRQSNKGTINNRVSLRRTRKIKATPSWAELDKIKIIYQKSAELSNLWNIPLQVDHIIPLISDTVCGLHCWHNLQLLEQSLNSSKHNNYQQDW